VCRVYCHLQWEREAVDEKVHKPPLRKQEVTCADVAWLSYNGTFANGEKAV
jgi:hypothetical protein